MPQVITRRVHSNMRANNTSRTEVRRPAVTPPRLTSDLEAGRGVSASARRPHADFPNDTDGGYKAGIRLVEFDAADGWRVGADGTRVGLGNAPRITGNRLAGNGSNKRNFDVQRPPKGSGQVERVELVIPSSIMRIPTSVVVTHG